MPGWRRRKFTGGAIITTITIIGGTGIIIVTITITTTIIAATITAGERGNLAQPSNRPALRACFDSCHRLETGEIAVSNL